MRARAKNKRAIKMTKINNHVAEGNQMDHVQPQLSKGFSNNLRMR